MTGDRFELGGLARLERLAPLPGVLAGRDGPESALAVAHDPVLRASPVHVEARDRLPFGDHRGPLLSVMVLAVTRGASLSSPVGSVKASSPTAGPGSDRRKSPDLREGMGRMVRLP